MISDELLKSYIEQFDDLSIIVSESNRRVVHSEPDELFQKYLNVFVKAYLVSACSILEAFVTDCGDACLTEYKSRVLSARIPHNLVEWEVIADDKKKNENFGYFEIKKNKKSIKEDVSGNYYLTIKLFKKFGIDLSCDAGFADFKDTITSTVIKRNAIVHHNDEASDISLPDVLDKVEDFKKYILCIQRIVNSVGSEVAAQ